MGSMSPLAKRAPRAWSQGRFGRGDKALVIGGGRHPDGASLLHPEGRALPKRASARSPWDRCELDDGTCDAKHLSYEEYLGTVTDGQARVTGGPLERCARYSFKSCPRAHPDIA